MDDDTDLTDLFDTATEPDQGAAREPGHSGDGRELDSDGSGGEGGRARPVRTIQDYGGAEWDVDDLAAGWDRDSEHLIQIVDTDGGVCQECGREFNNLSPVVISCHYWGVPRAKFDAVLEAIEEIGTAEIRRYYETTALEPGHLSMFDLVAEMQGDNPRWAPPGLIALVAVRYINRVSDSLGIDVADVTPGADSREPATGQ